MRVILHEGAAERVDIVSRCRFSRGFVLSLALTGVVATLLMLAIGNNVARGLGLLGTLAIIRFRFSD